MVRLISPVGLASVFGRLWRNRESKVMHILSQLLNVPSTDPDDGRRRRLLNILLLSTLVFAFLALLATAFADVARLDTREHVNALYLVCLLSLVGVVVIFAINRYWSGQLAGALFSMCLIVVVAFFDDPQEVANGCGLLVLVVPILVASFLLRPGVGFVVAGLNSLVITAIAFSAQIAPNPFAMIFFFAIALVSYLSSGNLERALEDLRAINQELDQSITERTRDLQRRSIQLQTASEVARDATAILNVDQLLDETVRLISDRFGFYHAGVYLVDERGDYVVLRSASSEKGQRMLERGRKLQVGEVDDIVGCVAGTGEARIALNVGEDAVHFAAPDLPETHFDEMALPMISRGRVIGVLDIQSVQEAVFTKEDVATLQTMADQLATAVENARLFEETNRRLAEARLIQEVMLASASTLNFDLALERTIKALNRALGIDRMGFLLPYERDGTLVLHPSLAGFEEGQEEIFQIPIAGSLVGQAYRTGQPVLVRDMRQEGVGFEWAPECHSVLAVPVRIGDRIVAVLHAESLEVGAFSEEELLLFITIAGQLGVTLENARLYRELQETNRLRTELVQNVGHELRTPLSLSKGTSGCCWKAV